MSLSAFVVTRDAAHLLPHVAANLRRYVDELVIVVDAATMDDSAVVAARLADRCEVWDVGGCPEHVRNEAAALCHGDWLLMADDDELWSPAWGARLPDLLGRSDVCEWVFPRRHVIANGARWITSEPWWPDWQIRLRRKAVWQAHPWPKQPHAVPPPCGRVLVNAPFWHLKFIVQDVQTRLARMNTWGELWAPATGDHYRKFAMPEDYAWQTAPVDEEAPAELAAILRLYAPPAPDPVLP